MWIVFAAGSALFAGLTSILAKCGIKHTDSNVATAIRTIVVLLFSWLMVLIVHSYPGIAALDGRTILFLILSGLSTGASWLCYFRALQIGDVNKVTPVDKCSVVLTILLSFLVFQEPVGVWKIVGLIAMTIGTLLMITRKETNPEQKTQRGWLIMAVLSAVFASLTSIFGKLGISGVESNLGTALRTIVVLVMAWVMVFVTGKQHTVRSISRRELLFICLSGIATGASWLCYYKALQDGPASLVVPIDKLSILVTLLFSRMVLKEHLTLKAWIGLILIVAGTLVMLL